MKKSYVAILLLGVVLGIAMAVPITALAQWALPFGGDQSEAGAESSATVPKPSPLAAANAGTSENTPRQANQAQQEDKHEKMMDQCAAMMDMMQDMEDMMGSGGMMGR